MRKVRVVARSTIDADVVRLLRSAIHGVANRTGGIGRHGVRVARRRESGQCLEEHLVVAAQRHGNVLQLLRADLGANLRPVCLQLRHGRADFDDLRDLANLQFHIDAGHVVHAHRHTGGRERAESVRSDLNAVRASREGRKLIRPCGVRLALASHCGPFVGDRHLRTGNHCSRAVGHVSDERSVQDLRSQSVAA